MTTCDCHYINIEWNCTIAYSSNDCIIRQIDLLIRANHQIRWSYFTRRKISPPAHSRLPHCTRSTLRHCFTLGKPFFLLSRVCKRAALPFGGQQSQKPRQATLNYTERNSFVDVNVKRTRVKLTRQIKNCVARYNELATTEWKFDEQTEISEWENMAFTSGVCRRSTRRSYEKR